MRNVRSINLLYRLQRKPNLIPIHRPCIPLQRIMLKINRVKTLHPAQLALNLGKRVEEVTARPEFLELFEVAEVGEMGDAVVGYVEGAETGVGIEALDCGQVVEGEV